MPKNAMQPTALKPGDAAALLTKLGGREISEEMIADDLEAGAPCNRDGTVNIVHYTAWLVREVARGD